jgi:predicted Fe-S protein YdhL (DUF1289 family)
LNTAREVCIGCYRTLAEIARWAEMSDAERETVLAALAERRRPAEAGGRRI